MIFLRISMISGMLPHISYNQRIKKHNVVQLYFYFFRRSHIRYLENENYTLQKNLYYREKSESIDDL